MTKNKDEKLVEKIEDLCNKIEKEENKLKIGIYKAKLSFLLLKIQKEIDLNEIKEKYEAKIKDVDKQVKEISKDITENKKKAILSKKKCVAELNKLAEYDPESSEFVFQEELDMVAGDVDELIKTLRENNEEDVADSIELACYYREEYKECNEELRKNKNKNKEIIDESIKIKKKNKKEYKSHVFKTKKKENIFKQIFLSIKNGWDEYKAQDRFKKEYETRKNKFEREQRKKEKEELEELEKEYKQNLEKFQKEYEKQLNKLNKEYEKNKIQIKNPYEDKRRKFMEKLTANYENKRSNERTVEGTREYLKKWQEYKNMNNGSDGQNLGR